MSLLGFELLYQKGRHVWFFPSFFPKVRTYGGHPYPPSVWFAPFIKENDQKLPDVLKKTRVVNELCGILPRDTQRDASKQAEK